MRRAALAAGFVLLAIVPVAGARLQATAAPPFPVSIVQGKPYPAQATVLVNGKVTWRNRDRTARRVKSDTNAWTAFTLRPGRSKTVTFRRRGCFRYKVDGRARGAVAVASTCGGGGGGGGGGTTKTVIYRYDVALVGHVKETQVTSGEPPASELNGTLSLALDWTGTFTNVAVKKLTVGTTWIVGMNTGLFASGTMTGTHVFSDSRGRLGGPCQGQVAIPSSEARFFVSGNRFPSTPLSEFHLGAQMLLEPGTAMANRINAAQQAACKGFGKGDPHFPFEEKDVQGLTVSPFVGLLEMNADRRDEAGRIWFPLAQLEDGQGFTIDTGLVTTTTSNCGTTCTDTREGQLKITLTPHR
jgi:plastocyanin